MPAKHVALDALLYFQTNDSYNFFTLAKTRAFQFACRFEQRCSLNKRPKRLKSPCHYFKQTAYLFFFFFFFFFFYTYEHLNTGHFFTLNAFYMHLLHASKWGHRTQCHTALSSTPCRWAIRKCTNGISYKNLPACNRKHTIFSSLSVSRKAPGM